ncbi:MAG: hypothetical protein D6814_16085 [Calditrichaeota bacterium]|nr:MAG: hypothetical protein D6814_16085 [Calditrichota bacterium]
MKVFITLLTSIYFLAAWPITIKTEYDRSVNIYPNIEMTARPFTRGNVIVEWTTQKENGILGFKVQRKLDNGQFLVVGFVPAYGDNQGHKYQYVDTVGQLEGLAYRLELVQSGSEHHELLSQVYTPHFAHPSTVQKDGEAFQ